MQCSLWAAWSDQGLEVDGFSSVDGLEVQHHHLESDVGRNRKPVEVMEEAGHMGESGWIANEALQRSGYTAVVQSQRLRVQEGDDQRLDQELRYLLCEERPDPADAAEGKSAVMLRGQSVQDYAQVPHCRRR